MPQPAELNGRLPAERRVRVRHPVSPETAGRFGAFRRQGAVSAQVVNVSTDGLGLLLGYGLPPGTSLVIEFRVPGEADAPALLARVAHATAQGDGTWLIGCAFDLPLTDDELRVLLS